jgi:hypothetical protein
MNHDLWMATPARRITAAAASMHFTAPGLIALVAVLVTEEPQIWRVGAAIGGGLGALVCGYAIAAAALTRWQRIQEAIMLALFLVITALAFIEIPFFGLRPIVVEALIDVGVLGLGVHFAWQLFTETRRAASEPA